MRILNWNRERVDQYELRKLSEKPWEYESLVRELCIHSGNSSLNLVDQYGRAVDYFEIYNGPKVYLISYSKNFYLEIRRKGIRQLFFQSAIIKAIIEKYGNGWHIPIFEDYPNMTLDDKIQEK